MITRISPRGRTRPKMTYHVWDLDTGWVVPWLAWEWIVDYHMPANLIMLPFTLHLHEQVALGCSKRIQMTQNVFPQTNWALKSAVLIRSAIRFDDFRISPSSNSTIPRSISVWQVFLDATRTYFSIALRLACSLSLDLLLFALGECDFRVYTWYYVQRSAMTGSGT